MRRIAMKGGWMVGYIHCVPGYLLRLAHWQTSSWKRSSQGWISDFNIWQKSLFTSSSPWIIAPPQNWKSKFVFRAHKWSRQKKTGTTAFYHYHYQGSQFIWIIAMITNLITGDGNDSGAHCRRAHCAGIGQWSSVANQSAFPLNLFHLCCPSVAGFLGSDSFVCLWNECLVVISDHQMVKKRYRPVANSPLSGRRCWML